jgi:YegS/Rv2252/BmrU family lipid kinase
MSEKVLFIFNPRSGKGLIRDSLLDIIDTMVKADFDLTVYTTQSQGDAIQKIEREAKKYDRIICSGGDGTLDEVVTGIIRSGVDIPIGYIPAGSTNDFANSLGIPKEMTLAAKTAVSGKRFPCDVGDFNGDTFVYVAAFGLFTKVSYETPQQMKNALGHLAYILEGVKELKDIPSCSMEVRYDGNVITDTFIYGMITNSVSVGGFKGITGSDVKLDDGVFEVTLIKNPKNPLELNEIIACLTSLIDDSDLIYTFKTDEIQFSSKEKIAWTLDGEFGGEHDKLVVRNLKQRIGIMVDDFEDETAENAE